MKMKMKMVPCIVALLLMGGVAGAQQDDCYTNAVNRMLELPLAGTNLAALAQHIMTVPSNDAARRVFESGCATNKDVSSIFVTLTGPELRALGFTLDDAKRATPMNRMLSGESPIGPGDVTFANLKRPSPRLVSGAIELSAEGVLQARLFFRVAKRDGFWTPERLDIWNPHTSEAVPLLEWNEPKHTMVERMRQRSADQAGEAGRGE